MTAATEIVFLPGFDGDAGLRRRFVEALAERHPARTIGYPNRTLESLNGYARHIASQMDPHARPLVIAESFSGLVAMRWAANDPHVAGLVFCGGFAKSPAALASLGAKMPSVTRFLGSRYFQATGFMQSDPARREWSEGLSSAVGQLAPEVVGERLRLIAAEDTSGEAASLKIPVIVVEFENDLIVGRAATTHLASSCPGATLVRVPGPHFALETRPRECAEALRPHLEPFFDATLTPG
jgi:pimeloyl-ACP methyl ester carboxylesterase